MDECKPLPLARQLAAVAVLEGDVVGDALGLKPAGLEPGAYTRPLLSST